VVAGLGREWVRQPAPLPLCDQSQTKHKQQDLHSPTNGGFLLRRELSVGFRGPGQEVWPQQVLESSSTAQLCQGLSACLIAPSRTGQGHQAAGSSLFGPRSIPSAILALAGLGRG
jgi:hypothetical protein